MSDHRATFADIVAEVLADIAMPLYLNLDSEALRKAAAERRERHESKRDDKP